MPPQAWPFSPTHSGRRQGGRTGRQARSMSIVQPTLGPDGQVHTCSLGPSYVSLAPWALQLLPFLPHHSPTLTTPLLRTSGGVCHTSVSKFLRTLQSPAQTHTSPPLVPLNLKEFIFRDRGREGDGEQEKHQCVREKHLSVASHTGDLAHNPGMCPERESNQRPFDSQAGTQSTEPYHLGLNLETLKAPTTYREQPKPSV